MRETVFIAAIVALSGCYMSHEIGGGTDGGPLVVGDLPDGVVFDHPTGRFREVILSDGPLACDAVEYTALDATGSVRSLPEPPRWLSLVAWTGGGQSYLFHTPGAGIGPGMASLTIGTTGAVGDRVTVEWSADVITVGHLHGPSRPRYCGVLALRR